MVDSPSVCTNCRLGCLPLPGLVFRPLLQPECFPCALIGGYAVAISWEGVKIHGHSVTALLRPVSATMAWRRQKQRAPTLTLSRHYKVLTSAELLGTLLNADCTQESKLFLFPVFAPNQMVLSGPILSPKLYRIPRGGAPWSTKGCITIHLNYHANRI